MTAAPLDAPMPGPPWAISFNANGCDRLFTPEQALLDLDAFGSGFLWLHFDLKAAKLGTKSKRDMSDLGRSP